jgi:hypothetical protein
MKGSCVIDAGCSSSLGLYCNLTGQDTVIFNGIASLRPGKCYCKPYYYFKSTSVGCIAQLTLNATCNATAYPGQCLSESGLYCDSTYSACFCASNYYWSSSTSKCCTKNNSFLLFFISEISTNFL